MSGCIRFANECLVIRQLIRVKDRCRGPGDTCGSLAPKTCGAMGSDTLVVP
ncbi:hypothetical protein J6590_045555 [Homalodisca vitripennis]|nr:hypothetical protein J6590_045555 [Homalodisca vitripennis]